MTKNDLVSRIYGKQRFHSRERKHNMPEYSNLDLRFWLFSQPLFHKLYKKWEESGYKKELVPSVDRLDDYRGYSFDNIQLMTWCENKAKGESDRKSGINNKVNKAVLQLNSDGELVTEFHSTMEAQRQTGIYCSNIGHTCNGRRKTAGGFIWKFKKDTEI